MLNDWHNAQESSSSLNAMRCLPFRSLPCGTPKDNVDKSIFVVLIMISLEFRVKMLWKKGYDAWFLSFLFLANIFSGNVENIYFSMWGTMNQPFMWNIISWFEILKLKKYWYTLQCFWVWCLDIVFLINIGIKIELQLWYRYFDWGNYFNCSNYNEKKKIWNLRSD